MLLATQEKKTLLLSGFCLAVVALAALCVPSAPAPGSERQPAEKTDKTEKAVNAEDIDEILQRKFKFNGADDPKVTLAEVLDLLSQRLDVKIVINERAFKLENVQDVYKTEVAQPSP